MCGHRLFVINDVRVCVRCGLTVTAQGHFIGFDKNLVTKFNKKRCKNEN